MAILPIIKAPSPILKKQSIVVDKIDQKTKKLMSDMVETMYHDEGVGLAAIQVGIALQIIVMDLRMDDDQQRAENFYPLYLVNPVIKKYSQEMTVAKEGCLSVPEIIVDVPRPEKITVEFLDFDGVSTNLEVDGWLARVIQHEMDHLVGKTILDYLSKLKKDIAISKLKKLNKQLV
ncbi:MAG: peptide deformylase [Rickettsiaceae bacterium]|nr:peptide deformylase [Rickettsiaceae bacterium]